MWITKTILLTVAFYYLTNNLLLSAILGFLVSTLESVLGEMWNEIKVTRLIKAIEFIVERKK